MSRIGKKLITLPKGVTLSIEGNQVKVKGPKGSLARDLHRDIKVEVSGSSVVVKPATSSHGVGAFHGLSRTLVANMVHGVSEGYSKSLTLIGVGYRAATQGKELNLTLGFSHPVKYTPPEGINIAVDKQTTVIVSGADKEMVGQVAANIRSFRPPEPYHGKGVRYTDEVIVTKVGKAGGK